MSLFILSDLILKNNTKTKDPVNQPLITLEERIGLQSLGVMNNAVWYEDPKRLVFTLARYKFVAKMLAGKQQVAEIGCGDGFGSRIVRQEVVNLLITDYDSYFIEKFKQQASEKWPIDSKTHNILAAPLPFKMDAIYSLDVLEHINTEVESHFLTNVCLSLKKNGCAIIGMPSLESQTYASAGSREGHVNCKSGNQLQALLLQYFEHVFLFSMNDEVVHTGFSKMAHYLLALCVSPKS
jgi:2-polyprenyl-3-methyl-5-hydroxy-6-metoxy-1,4-benzoquinol methylase